MSTSAQWSAKWTKPELCVGPGFILEGQIKAVRMHSIFLTSAPSIETQEDQLPTRFIALIVEVDFACKRNFDKFGNEVAPKMNRASAVNKGHYLNQYERVDSKFVEKLSSDELLQLLPGGVAMPPKFSDSSLPKLHPIVPNHFEFWADSAQYKHMDLKAGDAVRIKTLGNSVFVDTLGRMGASHLPVMGGDQKLGQSWTTKIMHSAEKEKEPEASEERDESEWD
eukprot:TRINITY_DN3838_c0_g1_i3.p2 TRINITY_DN3838_c0_g1~~TRINITY_DN3838_c0_g1_i3.p2  ORF type:complete len:224 (-),score=36.73 TRINITY_DN3838_c0_g1_i3:64-735(-)